MEKYPAENRPATAGGKVTYYPPPPPHTTAGHHGRINGDFDVYLCTGPVCCQSIARGIVMGIAVGVLVFSIILLPDTRVENNAYVNADEELMGIYRSTRAVIGYFMACACVALIVEVLIIAVQITVRCKELKKHPLPAFHIADVIASGFVAVAYFAGGIAMSYYASVWSQPPDGCEPIVDLEIGDPCRATGLNTFGGILAGLSFFSVAALVYQSVWSVLSIIKKWDNY